MTEIPATLAAFASGGAGHGDYVAGRALFPLPFLSTLLDGDSIGILCTVIGLVQFPAYGMLFGWSIARKKYLGVTVMIVTHLIAAFACFAGALPNFA